MSHKHMRAAILRQAQDDEGHSMLKEGWCNFALVKVNKGMQVDTLVPQAMKDVPSCEKRRGAAKKR